MKKIKEHSPLVLLLIICIAFVTYGCMTEEEAAAKHARTYYANEDFVLIEKEELIEHEDGNTVKYRFWKLMRISNTAQDSIEFGEIKSQVYDNENNCGCGGNFYITNELWVRNMYYSY